MADNEDAGNDAGCTAPLPDHQFTSESEPMASSAKRTPSPAFQFYPGDFFSSGKVDRMSMTERGIYITLMGRYWLDGGLPADAGVLAAMCRMKRKQFERVWTNGPLHECFEECDGQLIQPRLDKERKKQRDYNRRQSDNAAKGWHSRRNATALPPPARSHPSGNASLSHLHSQSLSRSQISKNEEPLDVAFRSFQDAYPSHRRKGGHLLEVAFMDQAHKAGGASVLMAALENHKASEQWADPKLIPGMDTWINGEYWRQVLPSATVTKPTPVVDRWKQQAKGRV